MTVAARGPALRAPVVPRVVSVDEAPGVRVVFTGRIPPPAAGAAGANLSLVVGDGDVATARAAALRLVGVPSHQAVFMQQVHGGEVAVVTAADAGRGATSHHTAIPDVDALVTHDDDVALAVLVADCVPVVLVAPAGGVGVVHAGRGGVMAEVVANAMAALTDDPAAVVALIGPAIGGCCYEVPADLADSVAAAWPAARATTTWGTPSLDLPAAVVAQLQDLGVTRVEQLGACTRCHRDAWFSHRAATAGLAPAGRQAAIVVRHSGQPAEAAEDASLESSVVP